MSDRSRPPLTAPTGTFVARGARPSWSVRLFAARTRGVSLPPTSERHVPRIADMTLHELDELEARDPAAARRQLASAGFGPDWFARLADRARELNQPRHRARAIAARDLRAGLLAALLRRALTAAERLALAPSRPRADTLAPRPALRRSTSEPDAPRGPTDRPSHLTRGSRPMARALGAPLTA